MNNNTSNYEDFIEMLPVGVILIDRNLHIKGYNSKAVEMMGLEEADIIIENKESAALTSLISLASKLFNTRSSYSQQIIEMNDRVLTFTSQRVVKNGIEDLIIIVKDSTSLQSLEKIRRDYLGSILHSIRTPLATLTNSLNILSATASDILTGDNAEALSMSITEIVRLNDLIDSLKDLFYIESNLLNDQINISRITFKQLFDRVVKLLFQNDDLSIDKVDRLKITGDQSIVFDVDIDMLSKAVYNIVKNAIIYSPETSPISISAGKDESCTTITISDKGIGIADEVMPFMFSKFFREDNAINRTTHGHGLGLFIAKSWIELMHGTIICESNQSEGTVFSITFVQNQKDI